MKKIKITMNNGGNILKTQNHEAHQYTSTHPYVNDPRFLGGKTGTTDLAGETMMTILNIRENPIAIIVLHSEKGKRKSDTEKILSLIENKF
jgi:D-alanyl-D-alanine carboxypeptidase